MKRVVLVLTLLASMSATALAAHFGLNQGESLAQLNKTITLKKVKPFLYRTSSLPDGNVAFNDYRLVITPKQGLCKIIAWTPTITSSSYGEGVRDEFSNLLSALRKKYGHDKELDFLRSGSIWDEPRDWMMGLAKGERILSAYWGDKDRSKLPPELGAIGLEAHGINGNHAIISLAYEFANFDECMAWIKSSENSSL